VIPAGRTRSARNRPRCTPLLPRHQIRSTQASQALRAGLAALAALAVPILLTAYPRPDSLIANVVVLALCWTVGAYLGRAARRAATATMPDTRREDGMAIS
jgi:hypothetical protein